ncbi:uncharacterized protein J8A68_003238 [[Candida] subhashii]|uniref:Nucleolar protein Dnt1-like N-terminal domain-containing protein n=1 Tax=[Candida] subhashii TaxID=561895 RepID=A0A8J5QJF3_9ASCO|nr:uncharacterized protein J8A68_003238 [[Candida] subhashii]KAG7663238.1 hypothetical protein J8A68_003238 [[Candida] subhashii]
MSKLKLQVVIIPLYSAHEPTNRLDKLVSKRFLHLADPTIQLNDVKQQVETRYKKLYPEEESLQIVGFQDTNLCDLDPEYTLSDVFESGDVLRITVRNQFKRKSISPFNTSLQATETTPVPHNAPILTAGSDFISSRKRTQEYFDKADSHLPVKHSKPNSPVSSPQRGDHVVSSPVALLPPQTTEDRTIPQKKGGVPSAAAVATTEGNGKRITSGMLSIPPQTQLEKEIISRGRGRPPKDGTRTKSRILDSDSSVDSVPESEESSESEEEEISEVDLDYSEMNESFVVSSESQESAVASESSAVASESEQMTQVESEVSTPPELTRAESKVSESKQAPPKSKSDITVEKKAGKDFLAKSEILRMFKSKIPNSRGRTEEIINKPNPKPKPATPEFLDPKSEAVLRRLAVNMVDADVDLSLGRGSRRAAAPTSLKDVDDLQARRLSSRASPPSSRTNERKRSEKRQSPASPKKKSSPVVKEVKPKVTPKSEGSKVKKQILSKEKKHSSSDVVHIDDDESTPIETGYQIIDDTKAGKLERTQLKLKSFEQTLRALQTDDGSSLKVMPKGLASGIDEDKRDYENLIVDSRLILVDKDKRDYNYSIEFIPHESLTPKASRAASPKKSKSPVSNAIPDKLKVDNDPPSPLKSKSPIVKTVIDTVEAGINGKSEVTKDQSPLPQSTGPISKDTADASNTASNKQSEVAKTQSTLKSKSPISKVTNDALQTETKDKSDSNKNQIQMVTLSIDKTNKTTKESGGSQSRIATLTLPKDSVSDVEPEQPQPIPAEESVAKDTVQEREPIEEPHDSPPSGPDLFVDAEIDYVVTDDESISISDSVSDSVQGVGSTMKVTGSENASANDSEVIEISDEENNEKETNASARQSIKKIFGAQRQSTFGELLAKSTAHKDVVNGHKQVSSPINKSNDVSPLKNLSHIPISDSSKSVVPPVSEKASPTPASALINLALNDSSIPDIFKPKGMSMSPSAVFRAHSPIKENQKSLPKETFVNTPRVSPLRTADSRAKQPANSPTDPRNRPQLSKTPSADENGKSKSPDVSSNGRPPSATGPGKVSPASFFTRTVPPGNKEDSPTKQSGTSFASKISFFDLWPSKPTGAKNATPTNSGSKAAFALNKSGSSGQEKDTVSTSRKRELEDSSSGESSEEDASSSESEGEEGSKTKKPRLIATAPSTIRRSQSPLFTSTTPSVSNVQDKLSSIANQASVNTPVTEKRATASPKPTAPASALKTPLLNSLTDLANRGLPDVRDKEGAAATQGTATEKKNAEGNPSSDEEEESSGDSSSSDGEEEEVGNEDGKFLSLKSVKEDQPKKKKVGLFSSLLRR